MNITFDDRVVVVTGAADGLGRRFVADFRALGARVFCCDKNPDGLEVARAGGADTTVLDLTDREQSAAWIAAIEQQTGRAIDVLVNNAGGFAHAVPRPIEDVLDSEWDVVMAINPGTAFTISRAAVPAMKRAGKGRIINISSGAGIASSHNNLYPYVAAKHAIVGLTRQLADELGQYGITVNAVAPGRVISTEFSQQAWDRRSKAEQREHLERTFTRRLGRPDDVSNAVLFLASDYASWITGQVVAVNGGVRGS
jgi:3-oxoacyl-[acyl-carrier protein] reductase